MNIAHAHVFYEIDNNINHQYIFHGFYGQDIFQDEKMIVIVDSLHVEIIFTNELFSISCFYEDSKFEGHVESATRMVYVNRKPFVHGEYYNIHTLGFYASDYINDMPKLNAVLRGYDDLLFDSRGFKTITDNAFMSAMRDIYAILKMAISRIGQFVTEFTPEFERTAPPASTFTVSHFGKVGGTRISIYDDYKKHRDVICDMEFVHI